MAILLKPEVLDRLLLSKSFLERMRFDPAPIHDRHTLAAHIITAQDAAELVLAAICDELGCLPPGKGNVYLMNYFDPLQRAKHPEREVFAKPYFRNLNDARALLKHQGIFPDGRQWSRVAEAVFQHISKWCADYLGISFVSLDESALIASAEVRDLYDEAKLASESGDFKSALEKLALALAKVFESSAALRGLQAGRVESEDAIRLTGFGVHANDFLALQGFLPHVQDWGKDAGVPVWQQSANGHPGNWTQQNVEFCLRTFVDTAIKLQGARWVPRALARFFLYDQEIQALNEGTEIWSYVKKDYNGNVITGFEAAYTGKTEKQVLRTLKLGERIRATVGISTESSGNAAQDVLSGGGVKNPQILSVMSQDEDGFYYGFVLASQVRVTCVPKDSDVIRQYYPGLPVIDWEPE